MKANDYLYYILNGWFDTFEQEIDTTNEDWLEFCSKFNNILYKLKNNKDLTGKDRDFMDYHLKQHFEGQEVL